MQEMYQKSMQMIKILNIKSEKAYKALLKDYKLLSSESLKYISGTRSFYEIIRMAKELKKFKLPKNYPNRKNIKCKKLEN